MSAPEPFKNFVAAVGNIVMGKPVPIADLEAVSRADTAAFVSSLDGRDGAKDGRVDLTQFHTLLLFAHPAIRNQLKDVVPKKGDISTGELRTAINTRFEETMRGIDTNNDWKIGRGELWESAQIKNFSVESIEVPSMPSNNNGRQR